MRITKESHLRSPIRWRDNKAMLEEGGEMETNQGEGLMASAAYLCGSLAVSVHGPAKNWIRFHILLSKTSSRTAATVTWLLSTQPRACQHIPNRQIAYGKHISFSLLKTTLKGMERWLRS